MEEPCSLKNYTYEIKWEEKHGSSPASLICFKSLDNHIMMVIVLDCYSEHFVLAQRIFFYFFHLIKVPWSNIQRRQIDGYGLASCHFLC